jgi:hypothetical protein
MTLLHQSKAHHHRHGIVYDSDGPMCIHGYADEYLKKNKKKIVSYNRAINSASPLYRYQSKNRQNLSLVQLVIAVNGHYHIMGLNPHPFTIFSTYLGYLFILNTHFLILGQPMVYASNDSDHGL